MRGLTLVLVFSSLGLWAADLNSTSPDGTTPLHWAVRSDDVASVDRLLRGGANVNAANRYGVTPLELACANANAAIIKRLLEAGADPNAIDATGETVLITAVRADEGVEAVKALLVAGAKVNAKDAQAEETALMWAVRENHPKSVELLLEYGAQVNVQTRIGKTPARRPPNAGGGTHGVGIVRGGWPDRGAQDPTPGGLTPLLYAARDGRLDIAKMLVAKGADVNLAEANKDTPLLLALANNHMDMARFLIEKGADVNARDYWGRTPLWVAVDLRNLDYDRQGEHQVDRGPVLEMIRTLIDRGANVNARTAEVPPIRRWILPISDISWVDFTGQTPFLRASLAGDLTVMRLLLDHGADPNIPTFAGTTALMAAAGVNWCVGQTFTEGDAALMEAVKLTLEKGADINAANSMGITALIGAVNRGSNDLVEYLVRNGARLDVKDKEGRTLMNWAEGVFLATVPPERKPATIALLEKLMKADKAQ